MTEEHESDTETDRDAPSDAGDLALATDDELQEREPDRDELTDAAKRVAAAWDDSEGDR